MATAAADAETAAGGEGDGKGYVDESRQWAEVEAERRAKEATDACKIARLKLQVCEAQVQINRIQLQIDHEREVGARSGVVDWAALHDATSAVIVLEQRRDASRERLAKDHAVEMGTSECGPTPRTFEDLATLAIPMELAEAEKAACDVENPYLPPGVVRIPDARGKTLQLRLQPTRGQGE